MSELFALDFVRSALIASVCMGLLLSYLGSHVVDRGMVFADLALGQISMLGLVFAVYVDFDPTGVAVVFTLIGAFVMSFITVIDKRINVEAIIGGIYAVTFAVAVLLISKAAPGDADLRDVLFGRLFTVTSTQNWWLAGTYGVLGMMHFIFRKQFYELTDRFKRGDTTDLESFYFWNLLFYLSVGLAIALAVAAGGVIPAFSLIVIPPIAAIFLTRSRTGIIMIGLIVSILGSFLGIYFSVQFDFPAGSSIVAMLGVLFAIAVGIRLFRR